MDMFYKSVFLKTPKVCFLVNFRRFHVSFVYFLEQNTCEQLFFIYHFSSNLCVLGDNNFCR